MWRCVVRRFLVWALSTVALLLTLPEGASADVSFLPPWACSEAEVTQDDRSSYFTALRGAASLLVTEAEEDVSRRLDVYGGDGCGQHG